MSWQCDLLESMTCCIIGRLWSRQTQRRVVDAEGVARSVIAKLLTRFQETSHVRHWPVQGCPRATTANNDKYIRLRAHWDERVKETQILKQFLLATRRRVSSQTFWNGFHEGDLYALRRMERIPLTARHCADRRMRAAKYRDWIQNDWSQVLFTIESWFILEGDIRHVLIW